MSTQQLPEKIAFIGTYLPRRCGIATFNFDLRLGIASRHPLSDCFVIAINDIEQGYSYPKEVWFEIDKQDIHGYQRAANFINFHNIGCVYLQFEYGIFGGIQGDYILELLKNLQVPIISILHTILENPDPDQKCVMEDVIALSTRVIVMTRYGKDILREIYQVSEKKIDIIPHGVPDMPFIHPGSFKKELNIHSKYVLLTYGLISVNKGIEFALQALPGILAEIPNLTYIVLGATHPDILRKEGEDYRDHLKQLAQKLGVKKHVRFINKFVELQELQKFIATADIVITAYPDKTQITSGTLSYAIAGGKVIVSTPYLHAVELLNNGHGILVPFKDPDAITQGVISLLKDEPRRHTMRMIAYLQGREMVWDKVSLMYIESMRKAREALFTRAFISNEKKKNCEKDLILPAIRLNHLNLMSDKTGLLQHARFSIPNFNEGYCTDDNARALILGILLEELGHDSGQLQSLFKSYAAFIHHAYNPQKKRFRNFMAFNRRWLEDAGSDESQGRALWALGVCVGRSKQSDLQRWALRLFHETLPIVFELKSPRAWAFTLLGIHDYSRIFRGDRFANQGRLTLTRRLVELFERNADDDWPWFEPFLSYDNAKLPHALILSRFWDQDEEAFSIGLRALRWLMKVQTSEDGYFRPIGNNGWYPRNGIRAQFDQQPIEAYATISACLEAYRSTHDMFWMENAKMVFEWFTGRNDLGLILYDSATGGNFDGLQVDRLNLNQGAESTLSFLLSLSEMYGIMENS